MRQPICSATPRPSPVPNPTSRRRRHRHRPRRGLALLLVLWLVVVIGAVTMVSVASARRAGGMAGNLRARVIARTSAESGVVLATQALSAIVSTATDTVARREALNALDRLPQLDGEIPVGDGRITVVVQDIGTLLDVNMASDDQLTRFFALFGSPTEAEAVTRALARYRERTDGVPVATTDAAGGPIGGERFAPSARPARMIRSIDELRTLPGFPPGLRDRALPYLTVDGDGAINRRTASDTVRSVAGGELRDEPSRVLVISRGWQAGHPLTWEIQDVYAIQGNTVTFVRRRERVL